MTRELKQRLDRLTTVVAGTVEAGRLLAEVRDLTDVELDRLEAIVAGWPEHEPFVLPIGVTTLRGMIAHHDSENAHSREQRA